MMIAVCLFSISCSRTHPYQLIRDFHFIADKNFLTDKENGLAVAVRDSDATLSVVPQKKKKRREKIEKQSRDTSFPRSDSTPLQPFFFFRFTLISLASPTLGFTSRFSTRERERELTGSTRNRDSARDSPPRPGSIDRLGNHFRRRDGRGGRAASTARPRATRETALRVPGEPDDWNYHFSWYTS